MKNTWEEREKGRKRSSKPEKTSNEGGGLGLGLEEKEERTRAGEQAPLQCPAALGRTGKEGRRGGGGNEKWRRGLRTAAGLQKPSPATVRFRYRPSLRCSALPTIPGRGAFLEATDDEILWREGADRTVGMVGERRKLSESLIWLGGSIAHGKSLCPRVHVARTGHAH